MQRNLFICLLFLINLVQINAQTVGVFQNDSSAVNGYTLLFPNVSESTWLLDNCGNVVHQWDSDFKPGLVAYLLENGNLLRTARIPSNFNGGGSGGRVEQYTWDGDLIWSYNYTSADFHQHHDIEYLPNGNILLIAWERHAPDEALAMGKNPALLSDNGIWAEQIVEIQPNGPTSGEIVWEWHIWDHMIQDFDSTKVNYGVIADHPELMDLNAGAGGVDWIHFNSIDYNAELDQIVLSSRHLSEVYVIDHSTTTAEAASHEGGNSGKGGDILYRWGNPQVYDRGTIADRKLFGQHDAQWIEPGLVDEGKLMVFNNGIGRPDGDYSTVEVWPTPVDVNGNYTLEDTLAFGPNFTEWSYTQAPFGALFSSNISGAHRLPDGNTLICEGRTGHLLEIDYDGFLVWEYVSPVVGQGFVTQGNNVSNNNVFRAYRYPADYPAFANVELSPGLPLELEPTNQDCIIYDDTVSSKEEDLVLSGIRIVNNPIDQQIFIENKTQETILFEIADMTGKIVSTGEITVQNFNQNMDGLQAGMYLIRFVKEGGSQFLIEKIVKQ